MTIYIVFGGFEYEGKSVENVFSSKEAAEAFAEELKNKKVYDYVDVEEYLRRSLLPPRYDN